MSITYDQMRTIMLMGMGIYMGFWISVAMVVIFVIHRKVKK